MRRVSDRITVFSSRRATRAMRVQGARHALIGATLAFGGLDAIRGGHGAWPDVLGVVAGLALVAAFVVELRQARRPAQGAHDAHHGPGWVDLFAAAVTLVEAWHLHHQGKHLLPWAYVLVAAILFVLGVSHARLRSLRRLVTNSEGFDLRLSPWRRLRRRWDEIASFSVNRQSLRIVERSGRVLEIDLRDIVESRAVTEAFAAAALRAVPVVPLPAPEERALPSAGPRDASPPPVDPGDIEAAERDA